MDAEMLFRVIEEHAPKRRGLHHRALRRDPRERGAPARKGRIMDVVSRGGAFHLEWIVVNDTENPLYEQYDRLVDIAKKYDVTLSLGDGMRPGCLADATDRAQIQELIILGELARACRTRRACR